MNMAAMQQKNKDIIQRYGRPPSAAHHLQKLGEEFGELTASMAITGPNGTWIQDQNIVDEAIDMINVLFSLVDMMGHSVETRMMLKHDLLEARMKEGRFDRKWGPSKGEGA